MNEVITIHGHRAGEVVHYGINWQPWLRGANIISSSITTTSGDLEIDNDSLPDQPPMQRFTVSGGTPNTTWRGEASVTLSTGETLKVGLVIPVA